MKPFHSSSTQGGEWEKTFWRPSSLCRHRMCYCGRDELLFATPDVAFPRLCGGWSSSASQHFPKCIEELLLMCSESAASSSLSATRKTRSHLHISSRQQPDSGVPWDSEIPRAGCCWNVDGFNIVILKRRRAIKLPVLGAQQAGPE